MNMEAKGEGAGMLNRKCVVVRWADLTADKFLDLIHRGAGAILILLPHSNTTLDQETLDVSTRGALCYVGIALDLDTPSLLFS